MARYSVVGIHIESMKLNTQRSMNDPLINCMQIKQVVEIIFTLICLTSKLILCTEFKGIEYYKTFHCHFFIDNVDFSYLCYVFYCSCKTFLIFITIIILVRIVTIDIISPILSKAEGGFSLRFRPSVKLHDFFQHSLRY